MRLQRLPSSEFRNSEIRLLTGAEAQRWRTSTLQRASSVNVKPEATAALQHGGTRKTRSQVLFSLAFLLALSHLHNSTNLKASLCCHLMWFISAL